MSNPNLQAIATVILEFGGYLARTPEAHRRGYIERAEKALNEFTVTEIQNAAEELADQPTWPRMSRIPFDVAKIARMRRARRQMDEAPSPDQCGFCDGDGWVSVLHLWHAIEVIQKGGQPQTPYTCVVCCTCQAGRRRRDQMISRKEKPITYNPERHERVRGDVMLVDQWREAISRLQQRIWNGGLQ